MSEGKGCLKVGCIGCAAMVALPIGLIVIMAGLQFAQRDRDPEIERVDTEHRLPGDIPAERMPTDELSKSVSANEIGSGLDIAGSGAGTIELDFSMGDLTIQPGPVGSAIRVEGKYDRGKFALEEVLRESAGGDWTYSLDFDAKGGMLGIMARGGVVEGDNRITLYVPPGHAFRLVGKIGLGSSDIDLGGLRVEDIDLEIGLGDHEISFREPTASPMKSILLESSLGGVRIREIGNASPRLVEINHSMGDLELDLSGEWQQDAEVSVHLGLGGTRIEGPRDAHLVIEESKVGLGEVSNRYDGGRMLPDDAPSIRLSVTGSMGDLRIE